MVSFVSDFRVQCKLSPPPPSPCGGRVAAGPCRRDRRSEPAWVCADVFVRYTAYRVYTNRNASMMYDQCGGPEFHFRRPRRSPRGRHGPHGSRGTGHAFSMYVVRSDDRHATGISFIQFHGLGAPKASVAKQSTVRLHHTAVPAITIRRLFLICALKGETPWARALAFARSSPETRNASALP